MRGSSAGQPRRLSLQAAPVFAASHAPRFFLSFPRGVPLLASLEQSRPCRRLQSIRLCFASDSAHGVRLHPSQVCSHVRADSRFRITRPTCRLSASSSPDRFHRAEFRDDSVLVGQRHSQPEMDSASGLRSRLWSPLSGLTHKGFDPLAGFLPWVSSSCRYAGAPTNDRCRTSSWSRHRNDHKPLIRLPGSIRSWAFGAPLRRRVGFATGSSTCSG
jgi:hypothetical protein